MLLLPHILISTSMKATSKTISSASSKISLLRIMSRFQAKPKIFSTMGAKIDKQEVWKGSECLFEVV
eukprot:15335348-Ditylum_brightwellii.AAC.1